MLGYTWVWVYGEKAPSCWEKLLKKYFEKLCVRYHILSHMRGSAETPLTPGVPYRPPGSFFLMVTPLNSKELTADLSTYMQQRWDYGGTKRKMLPIQRKRGSASLRPNPLFLFWCRSSESNRDGRKSGGF